MKEPMIYSESETAKIIGVSRQSFNNWTNSVPKLGHLVGKSRFFTANEVNELHYIVKDLPPNQRLGAVRFAWGKRGWDKFPYIGIDTLSSESKVGKQSLAKYVKAGKLDTVYSKGILVFERDYAVERAHYLKHKHLSERTRGKIRQYAEMQGTIDCHTNDVTIDMNGFKFTLSHKMAENVLNQIIDQL